MWRSFQTCALGLAVAVSASAQQEVTSDEAARGDRQAVNLEAKKDSLKYYNEVWNDWQHERSQHMTRLSPPGRYKTDKPDATENISDEQVRAMEYDARIRDRELRDPAVRSSDDYRDRYLGSILYWTEANNYWTGPVRSPNEDKIAEAEEHTARIGKGPADQTPLQTDLDDFSELDRKWRQSDYQWRLTDYYWADPDFRDGPGYDEYWEASNRYWTDSDAYWYHSNRNRGVELPKGEDEYIASRTNQGKGVRPEDEN